jgi:hypothetical protein
MARNFEYTLPEPPFAMKPPRELTREEAERHFKWFTGISEGRRELLLKAMAATDGMAADCDYSPISLIPVWAWVSRRLQPKTETKLTPGSLALVLDAGFYLAEVFLKQHADKLRWVLWTRKSGPSNKAVIEGFRVPFVPSDLVKACAWIVLETGPQDDLLYKKYLAWERKLSS